MASFVPYKYVRETYVLEMLTGNMINIKLEQDNASEILGPDSYSFGRNMSESLS